MSTRLNKFLLSVALLLSQASALNWTLHNSDNGKNLRATGDRAGYSNAEALIEALTVSALQPSKTIFAAVSDDASFTFPGTVVGLEAFHNERMARHAVKTDLPAATACIVRKLFSPDQEDRHPMFSDVRAFSINVLADSGFVFTFYFNSPDLRLNLDSYMSRLEFGLSFTSCMPGSTPEMRNRLHDVYVQLNRQLLDRQASGSLGNLGSILNIPAAPAQTEVVQVTQPSLPSTSDRSTQPQAAAQPAQPVANPAKAEKDAQAALEELLKGTSTKKTLTKKEKEAEKRRLAAEKQIKEAEAKRRAAEIAAMKAEDEAVKKLRNIERAREGQRRKEEEMEKAAAEAEARRREEEERRRAKAEKKKVSPASSLGASPAVSTAAEIPVVKMPVHNPANVVTEAIAAEAKPSADQAKPFVQVKSSNAKAVVAESKPAPQANPVVPAKPAAVEAKPVEPVASKASSSEKTSPQAATSKPKTVYVNSSNTAVKTSPQGKPAASEHRTVSVTEQKQKYIPPAARAVTVQPPQQQPQQQKQQQKYSPQGSKAVIDQKCSPQDSRAASTDQQKFSPKAAPQEATNNSNQFKSRQQKHDRNAHRQVAMTSPVEKSAASQVSPVVPRAASAEEVVVPAVVPVVMPVAAPAQVAVPSVAPPPGLTASIAQPEKQENFDELLASTQETVDELTFGNFVQQSEASVVEVPPAAPVLTIPISPVLHPQPQPATESTFEVNWTPYTNGYSLFGNPEPVQVPKATPSFDEALQQFSAAAASIQQQQIQPLSIDISDSHLRGNVANGLYSPLGLLPTRAQEGSGLLSSSSSGSSANLSGFFGPFPSSLTRVQSPLFGSVSAPATSVAPPRSSVLESSASAPSTFSLFSEPANQTPRRDPWADFEARNSFLNPSVPPFSPATAASNGLAASATGTYNDLNRFSSSSTATTATNDYLGGFGGLQGSSSGFFGTSAGYPSHSFGGSSYHQPQQQQQQQQPHRAPSQQQQSRMHMQHPNQRDAYGEQRFYRRF